MFDGLTEDEVVTCENAACSRSLPAEPTIVYRTIGGERRAYQCSCGAVTITVARDGATP